MECEALLIATGRSPNVRDLGLEIAGIAFDETDGIQIDPLGATTNPSVFAIGDCAAGVPRFTHVAGEMAKLVVQNALFGDTWQSHDGGFVEIHCKQGTGTIVGATVVAANAGDMISEITLAMQAGVGLDVVARVIHPYPTAAEGVMQAGL
ncbi:pyridine nucleotide-disulfide oxidoreductase dimerization region, partial [Chrysochromulina tobinii]